MVSDRIQVLSEVAELDIEPLFYIYVALKDEMGEVIDDSNTLWKDIVDPPTAEEALLIAQRLLEQSYTFSLWMRGYVDEPPQLFDCRAKCAVCKSMRSIEQLKDKRFCQQPNC